MKTLPRLPYISLLFAALAIVVAGASAHAVQSSATETSQEYAEYRNERWGFSLAVPASMRVGEYDQSYGGQELTFADDAAGTHFVITAYPYEQLDVSLGAISSPSADADQPDRLAVVNVFRTDTFRVWFAKNGVVFVVSTLDENEAWLTDLLQSWRFI